MDMKVKGRSHGRKNGGPGAKPPEEKVGPGAKPSGKHMDPGAKHPRVNGSLEVKYPGEMWWSGG